MSATDHTNAKRPDPGPRAAGPTTGACRRAALETLSEGAAPTEGDVEVLFDRLHRRIRHDDA
ncbi:hypothetical protein JANAI62_20450 [Jannaschia pagri]|uniref:Uncharacterized protein n=1 Tax=Jannaschia pagri TaxID=2829797 RepID=A0ABQ4NLY7_9RHOB|nr:MULTISPECIES: hypothetical protein [unclassified Jannaschia]GIT91588.1 hypothetical protein JANAI61_20460 [Jannaschia sp. AI_61]GIT95422.1 hypothetical protein JANAI62_20450 [Jannaschia sp. AI_62]